MALVDDLFFYNPWWVERKVPDRLLEGYRRKVFGELLDSLSVQRVTVLKGARRVGKTTLVYQVINELLGENSPNSVMYLSFDDPKLRVGLEEILGVFEEKVLQKDLLSGKTFVFMDEVQFLEGWELEVKKFFDRKYPIKFFATGSAATLIKKGTESLAGRTIEYSLAPFSFKEFFEYKTGIKQVNEKNTVEVLKVEKQGQLLFQEYLLKGGFPTVFSLPDDLWRKALKEDVVEKTIHRDIAFLYDVKRPVSVEKLLFWVAGNTGGMVNKSSLSSVIDASREYTEKYLTYLKNSFLIVLVGAHEKTVEGRVRKSEKAYIIDPGLANALLNAVRIDDALAGKLVETVVANNLSSENPRYYSGRKEVDFIAGDKAIEVKYQQSISESDLNSLKEAAKRLKAKPLIITKKDFDQRDGVSLVPAWLYLLREQQK